MVFHPVIHLATNAASCYILTTKNDYHIITGQNNYFHNSIYLELAPASPTYRQFYEIQFSKYLHGWQTNSDNSWLFHYQEHQQFTQYFALPDVVNSS